MNRFKSIIKIEGQDNNVAHVLTILKNNQSIFMSFSDRILEAVEMYGLGNNPRWFGADIQIMTYEKMTEEALESFRREFPNVNAEVAK
jgi:hypothetical protein